MIIKGMEWYFSIMRIGRGLCRDQIVYIIVFTCCALSTLCRVARPTYEPMLRVELRQPALSVELVSE